MIEGSRCWLRENLHALDAEHHVEIRELIQPGSQDLQGLFSRQGDQQMPLANDTSIGVGYAPMTSLERLVLSAEQRINNRERDRTHPAWGEDVKIMGVRRDNTVSLTVACARGNRVNGLITPGRPMSLEAAAGKNPVSHVGKIYNVLATDICKALVAETPEIAAHCLMVSQIGSPISTPAIVQIKVATRDKAPAEQFRDRIEEITAAQLVSAPKRIDDFIAGQIDVF